MAPLKKSICTVWRDGFFFYLCTTNKNKQHQIDMTQEEAVIKALQELGGKASLKQIYPVTKRYVTFGSKTPNESIRAILQRSPKVKRSKEGRGWWELLSYQDEMAKLKEGISKRDKTIIQLTESLSLVNIFEKLANAYLDVSKNKDRDDRKTVCETLNRIKSTLNISVSNDLWNRIEMFGMDNTTSSSNVNTQGINNGFMVGGNLEVSFSPQAENKLVEGLLNNKKIGYGNNH